MGEINIHISLCYSALSGQKDGVVFGLCQGMKAECKDKQRASYTQKTPQELPAPALRRKALLSPPTAGIPAQHYDTTEPGLLTIFGRVFLIHFSLCLFLSLSVSI